MQMQQQQAQQKMAHGGQVHAQKMAHGGQVHAQKLDHAERSIQQQPTANPSGSKGE
jgi:hypothetical protein